ncbi:MAG: ankyrin repeat domain-containing protein [Bdellovibrionales bacterium]|jgi:hypothetical protein|nr:ankyrin repeat domain-containing protein [Bdellovibrionales bacterium]
MLRLNDFFNSITGGGIDKRNADGETKLFRAVREGNTSAVKKLLRAGADPDIADNHGMTPLHQAAYWGEDEIVSLLLKSGAAPNIDNGQGWTPLHSAALAGGMKSRGDIIESLKSAGATDDLNDKHGWTARDYMQLWAENSDAAQKLKQMSGSGKPPAHAADTPPAPPAGPVPPIDSDLMPPPKPPHNGAAPCGPRAPHH